MKKKPYEITKDGLQMLSLKDTADSNTETVFVRKNSDGTIYFHVGYTQINIKPSDAKAIINMLQTAMR